MTTYPNTNPRALTTLTLTLTDPYSAFESFCAPIFCDFKALVNKRLAFEWRFRSLEFTIRYDTNYYMSELGHIDTSFLKWVSTALLSTNLALSRLIDSKSNVSTKSK